MYFYFRKSFEELAISFNSFTNPAQKFLAAKSSSSRKQTFSFFFFDPYHVRSNCINLKLLFFVSFLLTLTCMP
jgi:hypothetical protein